MTDHRSPRPLGPRGLKLVAVEALIVELPAVVGGLAAQEQVAVLQNLRYRELPVVIQIHFIN